MPRLYLLRHAEADGDAEVDFERPLSDYGTSAAARMGRHLDQLGARAQRVLCSASRRTLETWSCLSSTWQQEIELVVSDELYLASGEEILALLHELPAEVETVLVIAHYPGTQELATALAAEGDRSDYERMRSEYPTAALCELAFDCAWAELAPGAARLVRFDVPSQLG